MIRTSHSKIFREDWYLLVILMMMAVAIVMKSYFNPDGYLSADSTYYLRVAQSLLEGKGYFVKGEDAFAMWPLGYPTLIFLAAKLTGLSVFWSSKFINIILLGSILGGFRVLFKNSAYLYGLILLFSAYIEIFSYTWSETIFIATLVWFAASIYFFISNPKKITLLYISIMMSSQLLFLSRYIGSFSFGLIGLLGLYYGVVKKNKSKAVVLIGIAAINIGIMILYLFHNYTETGFPTGMRRLPSSETNLYLFTQLIKASVSEMLMPTVNFSKKVILVQFSILGLLLLKYRKNILRNNDAGSQSVTLSIVFGVIGLVYLFFIILMRWLTQFDGFGFRLLAPGSLLLFVSTIYFLQKRASTQFFNAMKNFLIILAIFSYLRSVPYDIWKSVVNFPIYYENLHLIEKEYADVEKDSIIIFGSDHLNYLYTDMQNTLPYYLPYYTYKEKWSDFMIRIDPGNNRNIYISIPKEELSAYKFDQTVIDFVKEYNETTVVKLR